MTRNDFILQAMLQMAANPQYATIQERVDDKGKIVKFPSLEEEIIFIDAEALACEAENRMDNPFDEPQETPTFSNNEHLRVMANNIDEHLDKLDMIADMLEQYIRMKS